MRTLRSVASNSSSSLGFSISATSSTSFLSQAVISTVPCTFETSTVASGATFADLVIVCWHSAGGAAAARMAATSHEFRIVMSNSPREAVTRGDDGRIQLQFLLVGSDEHALQHAAGRVFREGGVDLVGCLLHDLEVLHDRRARLGLEVRELPAE